MWLKVVWKNSNYCGSGCRATISDVYYTIIYITNIYQSNNDNYLLPKNLSLTAIGLHVKYIANRLQKVTHMHTWKHPHTHTQI